MIDYRPALIARCASIDDVVTAVRTARECDLEIGVRCGGHSIAGLAVPDSGFMIDLTRLDGVSVDPVMERARVVARCWARWIGPRSPSAWPRRPATSRILASAG
jgi:FAD/FMN-containing dehydrogenase